MHTGKIISVSNWSSWKVFISLLQLREGISSLNCMSDHLFDKTFIESASFVALTNWKFGNFFVPIKIVNEWKKITPVGEGRSGR